MDRKQYIKNFISIGGNMDRKQYIKNFVEEIIAASPENAMKVRNELLGWVGYISENEIEFSTDTFDDVNVYLENYKNLLDKLHTNLLNLTNSKEIPLEQSHLLVDYVYPAYLSCIPASIHSIFSELSDEEFQIYSNICDKYRKIDLFK